MSKTPGTHRLRGLGLFLLAVAAALLPSLADASSTIRAFAQRHQATGRVDSVLIGNQLLNCPTSASCTTARNGSGNNNNFVMARVDVDTDGTTFTSSSAPLSIPVGSTVQRAYLYWGADTTGAGGGSAAPTPANRNQVRFSAAGGAYTTVTATTLDALTASRYSAVAEVTSLVQAAGNGTYMVANVQSGTGTDRYAGWSLVVIYSNPTLPLRSITLFDGSLNINSTAPTSITTTVSGFRTPATGAVDARIGLVAFEGDNAMTGDQFLVNSTAISDALNPNNNVFNSTNSRLGVAQTGRNPQQSNMFGFDIDYIPVAAGVINNNDTSASLTFNTGGETYFPIALLFQTNVYEPEIVTNFSKAAVDINGGQFRPGDIVEYTISLSNTGDDAADQTVITDPLPLGLTYVLGSIEVLTGPNAGAKTDAAGDDQADYNAGTRTITVRVGSSANASTGGRITPIPQAGSATSVRFRAQIDANQPNGANLANIAGIGYVGATSGTPGSGNSPPSTITVSRNADLAITKTGPANVIAGAPIQYVLTLSNLGPDSADGATITDNVPAGITGVSITCTATNGAVCPSTAGLTTLSALAIPTLPSTGELVFTINGTAPMSATSLSNSASVSAPAGTVDVTAPNNFAGPVNTTVDAGLDLAVTGVLTTVGTIRTGDPVAYQFTVTNNGPVVAPDAPFTLPMPTGLAGGTWTCAPLSRCGVASGTGDIALTLNLAVGESVTITFGGTAPATTPSNLGDAVGTVAAPPGLGDNTPGNNTATVPAIVVQARDLVANPDAGSIVNGNLGGTAVPNVLANDQFNGGPATLGNVTLSQVSTTHPNVTLDPGTGAIVVAPGTPSGSYTVVYQICETANPGNCTQASVTVDVTNTPPVVQDDTATVVQSSTGNAIDVLANDSDAEDGAPVVTPASGSTANGGSFNCTATGCTYTPPLGFVGSDSFSYQACDSAGECSTAIVNITVQPRTLAITAAPVCLADAAYLDYSIAGGNFDATGLDATIEWLDGLGNVVSTLTNQPLSGQLLWPGMVLNAGVPVDWPGWVLSGGLWIQAPDGFEGLRPTATVRITVNPTEDVLVNYPPATPGCAAEPPANQPPVAVDDSGSTVGLAPVVTNVLANDSDPEAGPLVVSIATPPGSGSVVVNGDGSITYTPALGFQGVVTYEYTITDAAGLTSTATVTITVDWLDLAATADTGTVADGAAGGVAVPNVLANDTLDGAPATLATVSLAQVSTTNPNVTLDPATGEVEVAPGTPAGSYTLVYEICELANPANCEQASVTVTVGAAVIDAVDDDATGTPVTGAGGGTIPSVLGNDTLGGSPVTVGVGGNVTLSPGAAPTPTAGSITMNADGSITIAAGTTAGVYAYDYTICEVLNPTNCDTATVAIVVAAAVIDAIDDSGTVASGASGGTAVANVLANDTLDGAPATLATVSLSQLATSHPNVTLNPATGEVSVAAGTPAGSYTVTYEVCELLNPSNCDVASVTVTVGAAPLLATDDTGAVANGADGGVAVANVLANDTLDGVPATLATVVLSQTATTHPNVTLNPATGEVSVAPGTPAGTYTVTYQICEQLNPTNCSSASVTVTVGAAVIDAVDDDATGTPVTGAGGGTIPSVLGNDTLGGAAVTVGVGGNVTLSPGAAPTPAAGSITMNADGTITIAPGTSAGVYSYGYTICEVLNPTNCDTAIVTLVVDAAVIDAVDDTGTVASGAAGGTAVANVLVNDNLDGAAATLATVTLAQISTTDPNITLDPATGAITVSAGTPAGTYTVVYQICEVLNPANCDTATVTVTVGTAVIDAVDDVGTVASGAAGGVAVPNVLINDSLDGSAATLATVTLSQISTSSPNVTLDPANGAINVAAGTPAGTYTVVYQICEVLNPANCDTATVTATVGAAVIDAVDDTGTVASGAAGGVAAPNVLANDTLGGSPATLATVTLSQVSTTNPNVTLDPATGAVAVAPGTPAGTYTVTYEICEQLNPTNCDQASVTVTVGAAAIDAVDDTGAVASGAAGGTAVPNVLANDTLGGAPATLATVALSQVSTTNPNVTLDPATGAITVSAGTPAGTYTVVYQICEILNPTNCDQATVTVTVGSAVIDAVDDTGTVTSGAAGGTAVPNVLANDTLGGAPATLASVTLSQVSTSNPNVTLDPATGAVDVAPGAPAGTYTVVYEICEILNPSNCDTATVTVTVGAAVIDAVDDTGTVASGATGGIAVPNVLANDTLDGSPATLATVTLTQVSTSNPNVTLDPATGAINVAPGTPAGTYTVVYEICEILNPTNCDQASVTVTVGAAVIDAVDDTGTVASGATGGIAVANVLVNDTLDGAPATLGTVTLTQVSTSNPNVTLDPASGAVNVASGTPAGAYTVVYQICEILNPTNCDQASVTVTVGAAAIDAVDDTGTVASGATGGTAVANVLINDTLDGAPATLATVTLSQFSTSSPNVTLDPATGAVNVAPGTAAGSYTLVYEICEILNPTNCDTATVTVTVGAAVIDAVDDTETVASGATGGIAVPNVLVNDTLDGAAATLATVTLAQVSTSNPNVTLDPATGAVNVASGTPAGAYTVVYQICEILNPTNCDTATVTVTVGAAVIDAVDDTGTVASGATGGVAVPNVLVNDLLDGAPATLASVTLAQVSTSNPNVTLNPATGEVVVAAGTPAGTYTVVYEICEILNPTNCDQASVTVTVGAAVIDAVDDSGTVASGAAGGVAVPNVLVNDALGGSPATLASVTLVQVSTSNPNVTLNPATGEVVVAAGTPAGTYTVVYEICEILNPTNCDQASVTVTVGAAVIDAVDDTGTVGSGATGGIAIPNVLVNDTLDGAPATLATVTLAQISTTNPNVTVNPATGEVVVAAGTPAGTYTVVYEICEILNPTNCDTATVTVTVGAAVIDAVDDTGTVASGAAGGVAVPNVLVNDTLDGAPATLATVTLSQISTTNPNVTLDPATGAVNVAPGTAAGTYTVVYQICELLNPANCDTATATVTVGAAVIDAVDDSGTLTTTAGGTAIANVLVNDTLDAAPATLATVTLAQVSTSDPNVTLDPATGAVNVAPGTPAGTYTLVYEICEILNPANCDQATATVTVIAPAVAAADDTGATAQNTPVTVNVLANDGFGGGPAAVADVTVTIIAGPANGSAVVNADGSITYTPAANYSGPDQLRYRICGVVNPGVCAEAVVDLVVAPNTVTAPDDSRVTTQATPVTLPLLAMAGTGGGAPLDPASLQIVGPAANGTVVINPDGSATYTPNTLFFGTDSFQYRICDQSVPTPVCAVGTITITVEMATPQLRISKTTPATTVRVGDFVRYSVMVENTGISPANNVTVLDLPPAGFTYVEGSLAVVDADGVHGLAGAQPLRITGVDIPVGGTATIAYLLRVGAGTGPGVHTNTVSATDAFGVSISNTGQADVIVEGDPLLEESLVLGTVFLDTNGDGRQQSGEPGLAGVRLATVEGLVVETDVHGRFHLVGIDGGHPLRGRNAILKVDVATLPPGSRFTTPNPLVRRITPGIPVRFDFGVQLPDQGGDTHPETR